LTGNGTCEHARVLIRGRTEEDLGPCDLIARAVHETDGYPLRILADMRSFLVAPDELAAWVGEVDGEVAGHVSLRSRCSPGAIEVASRAAGVAQDGLGVVSRLLVSPAARRLGIGRGLLEAARAEAASRGLVPMLEVVTWQRPAVSLYEALGWSRVGESAIPMLDGSALDVFVYVHPGSAA
jgi:GNAT superfamily N-acetyltransferase